MRLGIAGTGKIVQEALPVLCQIKPERMILMGREGSKERTGELTEKYKLDGYVLDFDALLAADIDTVYVALPNALHCEFAERALLAGKHVIVEKPAAVTKKELEELYKIAAAQKKILVEAMTLHFLPAWISLKEKLAEIGEIKLADFQFCQYSSRYDAFRSGETPPVFDPALAGGALMDLNVYNIHAAVSLFGAPAAVCYHPNMERGIDTSGVLTMDYGTFRVVSLAAKDCQGPNISNILGTKGCICIPAETNKVDRYELRTTAGEGYRYDFSDKYHRMFREFLAFSRMIDQNDPSQADELAKISLDVMGVIDQARAYL